MNRFPWVAHWLMTMAVIAPELELGGDADHDDFYDDTGNRVLGNPADRVVVELEQLDNFDQPFHDVVVGGGDGEGF